MEVYLTLARQRGLKWSLLYNGTSERTEVEVYFTIDMSERTKMEVYFAMARQRGLK